jgi:hypothetical protein
MIRCRVELKMSHAQIDKQIDKQTDYQIDKSNTQPILIILYLIISNYQPI